MEENKQEWVSVKTKLSRKGKEVLLWDASRKARVIGTYWGKEDYGPSWTGLQIDGTYHYDDSEITHWMPLPSPPKL